MRQLLLMAATICSLFGDIRASLASYAKVCKDLKITEMDYRRHRNLTRLRSDLLQRVAGCQYVHGNVEFPYFGIDRHTGKPLDGEILKIGTDFLDSIEEVHGSLLLQSVSLERIVFKNLRLIRGLETQGGESRSQALEVTSCTHLRSLSLPSLRTVANGKVQLAGNINSDLRCGLGRLVKWRSLFLSKHQRLDDFATSPNCSRAVSCHADCGGAGCWTDGDRDSCQADVVQCRHCGEGVRYCYRVDGAGGGFQKHCCSHQCLGGCSSGGADACNACRFVTFNGTCLQDCPKAKRYDPVTLKLLSVGKPLLRLGSVCVEECPPTFVVSACGRYCMAQCETGQKVNDGRCVPCGDAGCGDCNVTATSLSDSFFDNFTSSLCSTWNVIGKTYFRIDIGRTAPERLRLLRPVQTIDIKSLTVKNPSGVAANLSFLQNLTEVSGNLIVTNAKLRFLALRRLRRTKGLHLKDVTSLCENWFPRRHLLDRSRSNSNYSVSSAGLVFDNTSSECRAAACDPQCEDECWGPGPDLCVACRFVSVDGACFASCREAGRFAENDTRTGGVVCRRCHPECAGGCDGPSAADCVRCRRFSEDGECVSRCSRQLRADELGVCYSAAASAYLAIGVSAAAAACALLLLLLLSCLYYSRRIRKYDMIDLDEILSDPNDPNDMAQLLMVNNDDVVKQKEIGSGAFGTVYKGMLRSSTASGVKELPVAIKVLKGKNPKLGQELLNEASVLARVKHPNCIRLVALCLTEDVQLITALMPRGSLLQFVKSRRNGIGAERILNWGLQVAEGMAYLESVSIVHRDLAARNVLLQTPDSVKITDFGLAKLLDLTEQEFLQGGGLLPVKWLSVECFESGQFSHKSDVWSYGVLLWEICTFGESPYAPYRVQSAEDISDILRKGIRLRQPEICSIDFYNVMLSCWLPRPDSRPRFKDLIRTMQECLAAPAKFIARRGEADEDETSAMEQLLSGAGQRRRSSGARRQRVAKEQSCWEPEPLDDADTQPPLPPPTAMTVAEPEEDSAGYLRPMPLP